MSKLPYLVAEINAALEVYLSGRTGQQHNRTAYILCDDGAELAGKLFLLIDNPQWSDAKANTDRRITARTEISDRASQQNLKMLRT